MSNVNKLSVEELKNMSISDVLDLPVSAIEEAAGYVLPPIGAYVLGIKKAGLGSIGAEGAKKETVGLDFTVVATTELADTTETPLPEGSEFSINYIGGGSLPYFVRDFGEISATIGATSLKDLFAKLAGVQITCLVTHNINPTTKKAYPQISDVKMV